MREGINHLPMAIVSGLLGAVSGAASAAVEPYWTRIHRFEHPELHVVGHSGVEPGGGTVAAPAPPQPGHPLRSNRHSALGFAQGRKGRRRVDQRCLSRWPMRRVAAIHQALGVPISTLPLAVPVSLRVSDDATGGNPISPVNWRPPGGHRRPVPDQEKSERR